VDQVFSKCEGELTVIAGSRFGDLFVYTNVGNLYQHKMTDGTVLFGSEPRQFGKKYSSEASRFELGLTVLNEKQFLETAHLEEIKMQLQIRKDNGASALHIRKWRRYLVVRSVCCLKLFPI
jgi:hypothetical protein